MLTGNGAYVAKLASIRIALILLIASTLCGGEDQHPCPLTLSSNKQLTTLHGKIGNGSHDMLLIVPHCDQVVVLVYAGDLETDTPAAMLNADSNLKRFRKYTQATYGHIGKGICIQCAKYDVEATLTGQLEVATIPEGLRRDSAGFLWDESGKLMGGSGFGHPNRSYKYRLVIQSVSGMVAQKRPKPKV